MIGNSRFALDGFFDQQLNGDVFLNSVVWLSERDNPTLSIRPKEMTDRRIVLVPAQSRMIRWLGLVILPLAGFAIAAVLWWRRR